MLRVTYCHENYYQPSCTLELHSEVGLVTLSSLKPLQICDLGQLPLAALSIWGKYFSRSEIIFVWHMIFAFTAMPGWVAKAILALVEGR